MPDSITSEKAQAAYNEARKRIEQAKQENAVELSLYDLPLMKLPPEIGRLTHLQILRLGRGFDTKAPLETLPPEIGNLTNLRELYLSQNNLTQLPATIGSLTSLQALYLRQNNLTQLPPEISNLTNLQELYISQNNLIQLPPEISQLKNLKTLDLRQNNLTELPPEILQLTHLETLDLSQNNLTQLPADIRRLTSLKSLNLIQNNLNQLPPQIGQLINLQVLDLDQNDLTQLPPEIGKLTKLQLIDLNQNNLSQFPLEITKLTNLQSLYLIKNNISQLPPEIAQLTNLKSLHLSQNNLTQLPAEIGQLANLQLLDLNYNQLKQLPPQIGQLTRLQTLHLDHNSLTQLPSQIGQLANLSRLKLMQNNLTQLPSEIGQLLNLTWLELSKNKLTQLPSEIGQLTNLTKLELRKNNLTSLPPEIGNLTNLIWLFLKSNNLQHLPIEITRLTNLSRLDLKENSKLLLPPEIDKQISLPSAILDFWQKQASQPHKSLNEAKFILVGQGGVGKTSLVQRLLHDKHDPTEAQTKGIEISRHIIPVPRGTDTAEIQLNIWDFGGQEIMHATHQFFLTKRSLYLLVLDARQGEQEGRVEYWLALIRSFAADSPILIVINKSDEHYLELNRKALREKYPTIIGFVHTSARTGDGLDKLKEKITAILAEMDHIDTPFPQSWMEIKNELETLQETRNFIHYYEYQQLCQKHEINNDSSQRILINFLHDLGILLNFQDDDRVRDTNILNPQWVTKGVYSLLNAQQLAEQNGILKRNQLPALLDKNEYPLEMHRFILQMMEKFELAFPFEGGNKYLVPDLLPVEEPAFVWDKADALNFEYHYAVLPHSILHRFIVRQHTRIHNHIAWRTGVILAHDNLQALIKADIEDKTIAISISGQGNRREFLSMLRFTCDSLHQSITGTKPTEQVPIPGYPNVVVSYAHLLKLEEKGIHEYMFEGTDDFLSVRALLGNIEDPSRRQLQGLTRQELYRLFNEHFNLDELRELCFLLSIKYENLDGNNLMRKALGLIEMMERNGRLPELVEALLEMRPFLLEDLQRQRPNVYR